MSDAAFHSTWTDLSGIGRDAGTGGYRRYVWTDPDLQLREWFAAAAAERGMALVEDGNGNQFAWWGDPSGGDAILTGSHLDSVPDGGAFDGPLGVVSGFAAVDALRTKGFQPTRPIVVANFVDEEGARFGIACAGSRLLAGTLEPERARALRDRDGVTLDEVLRRRGRDPERLGADPELLGRIGTFVELHVEQGRGLVDEDAAVGVASAIWPHGRWRFEFHGRADHAGTTRMDDRQDPMLTYAMTALAANKQARLADARATFGRIDVEPGGTNAIPSLVRAWLDARAADESTVAGLVEVVKRQAVERAGRDGTRVEVEAESVSPATTFDAALRDRVAAAVAGPDRIDVPILPTGAGHDAGVLSLAGVPTAMLFVRNPTGVSHAPEEYAEAADCEAGVVALARVLEELAGSSGPGT
ncbi:MAG TPA: allantoate amidohydrolase [Nocardioidaceae bacterium]|nr:allantoate amidohydrolase [Nocardioidaceae bacterium]